MSRYLCLIILVLLFSVSCHKPTNDSIYYTNDSLSIEMDYTKTTYREKKKGNGYYVKIYARKIPPDHYYIYAYDEEENIHFVFNMAFLKMPDGSFRLDSTANDVMQLNANTVNLHPYDYPTGPVTITHDGPDYLEGSFEGKIQTDNIWKQIKGSFRAEWENE